mmetsp:Transcript_4446/g.8033  ORF Transcript_4446/g.8033 Transcript_4446/m.8033 type:complete len:342 (+) Transcript_4446:62-1087(+)
MSFLCQVCFELQKDRLPLERLVTGNGDVLRSADCNHHVCQECMAAYVVSRVDEQRVFNVRCPSIGCTVELFEQDVRRLTQLKVLEEDVSNRFAELRARDFGARAQDLSQELLGQASGYDDMDVLEKLWNSTRRCPRCSLVIERSSGCNSFYCICGHHFNYSSAPRIFGNDVKDYGRVIRLAKKRGLSLEEAEKLKGGDKLWVNVTRVAAKANMTCDEAFELLSQAMAGDTAAKQRIQESRKTAENASEEGIDDWEPPHNLWDVEDSEEHSEGEQPIEVPLIAEDEKMKGAEEYLKELAYVLNFGVMGEHTAVVLNATNTTEEEAAHCLEAGHDDFMSFPEY